MLLVDLRVPEYGEKPPKNQFFYVGGITAYTPSSIYHCYRRGGELPTGSMAVVDVKFNMYTLDVSENAYCRKTKNRKWIH